MDSITKERQEAIEVTRRALQEIPLNTEQALANGYVMIVVFRDQDLHPSETLPFAPSSGSDLLSWISNQRALGRILGHHQLCLHRHTYNPNGTYINSPDTLVSCEKRFPDGDWMIGTIFDAIQVADQ